MGQMEMGSTSVGSGVVEGRDRRRPESPGGRKALRKIAIVAGLTLAAMALLVLAAAVTVSSQAGIPLGDVLAQVPPNIGLIAGIVFGGTIQTVLLLLAILAVQVVVHEGGHLLAGKLVGFRFVTVVLGPLSIETTREGRKVLRLSRQGITGAGAALSVPTSTDRLRLRSAIMTVGGPLATLALCPLSFGLSGLVPEDTGQYLTMMGIFSLALGVGNLLPIRSGAVLSDGARLKMLATGGARADRLCYMGLVVGASKLGMRPRAWDPDWIRRLTALGDHTLDEAAACHTAYYWAVDTGNIEMAEHYLQKLLSEPTAVPYVMRRLFLVDAAFFYAYYRHDPATARSLLDEVGEVTGKHRHMWLRAEAATLAAEGKLHEARNVALQGLAEIVRDPPTGPGWELDKEWTEALAGAQAVGAYA